MQGGRAAGGLGADWKLEAAPKRGTFHFFTYRPNFILPLHDSPAIDRTHSSPSPGRDAQLPDSRNVETKMQVSLRTRLAEGRGLVQLLTCPGAEGASGAATHSAAARRATAASSSRP